jgi:citrate/tricarballylate utilization protein
MRLNELVSEAERQLRICNACRYCEGYCAVWHAIEWRTEFTEKDVVYLANLCHDCKDCYFACPYTEPHEYAINPPKVFSGIRNEVYREYASTNVVGKILHGKWTPLAAGIIGTLFFLLVCLHYGEGIFERYTGHGAFYKFVPEILMDIVFSVFGVFVLIKWIDAGRSFWRALGNSHIKKVALADVVEAIKYALSLRYLGGGDNDCSDMTQALSSFRRWFHHLVFYGFLLDFASTTLAAYYSHVVGIQAPYPVTSPVVIFGVLGGMGIIVGGIGLLYTRARSTSATSDARADESSTSFTVNLIIVALTGMILLALRSTEMMGVALAVHLGSVVALFITAPYSKFAHFVFRFLALVRYVQEARRASSFEP